LAPLNSAIQPPSEVHALLQQFFNRVDGII
jgi:hypothetical protein